MISIFLWTLVGVSVLLLIGGLAFVYRLFRQYRTARTLTISTPNGIVEGRFVTIGETEQWVQIRGEDRANPILLVLHGQGLSMVPFTPLFRSWEKHFTVVQWDRHGAGKTMSRNGKRGSSAWTFERLVEDGIEVTEFLRQSLRQDKILLCGHSQGSAIGLHMIKRRPDLFHAYIGTGQLVNMQRNEAISYETALERARTVRNTRALKQLESIGAPPYPDAHIWLIKQRWSASTAPEMEEWQALAPRLALSAPNYSLRDIYNTYTGVLFLPQPLYEDYMAFDAWRLFTRFEVPFYLFQGDADLLTPAELAEEYFAAVEAPAKGLVLLKGGGHMAILLQSEQFLEELLVHVGSLRDFSPAH